MQFDSFITSLSGSKNKSKKKIKKGGEKHGLNRDKEDSSVARAIAITGQVIGVEGGLYMEW